MRQVAELTATASFGKFTKVLRCALIILIAERSDTAVELLGCHPSPVLGVKRNAEANGYRPDYGYCAYNHGDEMGGNEFTDAIES